MCYVGVNSSNVFQYLLVDNARVKVGDVLVAEVTLISLRWNNRFQSVLREDGIYHRILNVMSIMLIMMKDSLIPISVGQYATSQNRSTFFSIAIHWNLFVFLYHRLLCLGSMSKQSLDILFRSQGVFVQFRLLGDSSKYEGWSNTLNY